MTMTSMNDDDDDDGKGVGNFEDVIVFKVNLDVRILTNSDSTIM